MVGSVDEGNNVVVGAQVDFQCNDLSSTGTSFYHTQSDVNGAFSIKNLKGKLLSVNVSKTGYYSYSPHGEYFYYAGQNQNFVPDAGNPVVFRLRKRGEGVALFHFHTNFSIRKDGTPLSINLATGDNAPGGDAFKVEC